MTHIACVILQDRETGDGEDPQQSRLGEFSFVRLPVPGEIVTATIEDDCTDFRVVEVRHWPVPHPFVPHAEFASLQRKEAEAHVIVEWAGMA